MLQVFGSYQGSDKQLYSSVGLTFCNSCYPQSLWYQLCYQSQKLRLKFSDWIL